ncbi:hypothetical protein O181_037339 [Austropuccinia psidii MF-1]|uniref:C2H2-type domain-containing protein n=1 Tax=Austropuccinia psidii MF-1 TaxID=1389203 RepID=A0A9Q3D6C2_9BASI|nr:hypothetical protein [Austropuccinia psidii MF-1]
MTISKFHHHHLRGQDHLPGLDKLQGLDHLPGLDKLQGLDHLLGKGRPSAQDYHRGAKDGELSEGLDDLNRSRSLASSSDYKEITSSNFNSPLSSPPSSNSLLLLSSSVEAAVLESRKFERGSRHSSVLSSNPIISTSPSQSSGLNHQKKLSVINISSPLSSASSSSSSSTSSSTDSTSLTDSTSNQSINQTPITNKSLNLKKINSPTTPTQLTKHYSLNRFHSSPSFRRSFHYQRLHHRFPQSNSFNFISHHLSSKRDQNKHLGLFKCEKCYKVYRHPQCLIKHRWEHTSYWADASKLMLSKHQQVQLLEAAAILAAPSGSLPESRSLWPAAVSPSEAGLLGSDQVNLDTICSQQARKKSSRKNDDGHQRSNSLPNGFLEPFNKTTSLRISNTDHDSEMLDEGLHLSEYEDDDYDQDKVDQSDQDDDEHGTMFQMSLDGEDNLSLSSTQSKSDVQLDQSQNPNSIQPPIGYFQTRNPETKTTLENPSRPFMGRVPAMIAYKPTLKDHDRPIEFLYYPETFFKPMNPYADSKLRFEGKQLGINTGSEHNESTEEEVDDDDDDDDWSNKSARAREGNEVVGMEL